MFDSYPNPAAGSAGTAPSGSPRAPEDIFAELERSTGSAGQAASAKPFTPPAPMSAPMAMPGASRPAPNEMASLPPIQPMVSGGHSSLKYLLIGLLTLSVILGGGFYVYSAFLAPKLQGVADDGQSQTPAAAETDQTDMTATSSDQGVDYTDEFLPPDAATATSSALVDESINTPAASSPTSTAAAQTEAATAASQDSDMDGLIDERELALGSDINLSDTDGDGLSDYEEVMTWKTDPSNPDTDGDTYSDGQEVKARYNPLGPGKMTISQ